MNAEKFRSGNKFSDTEWILYLETNLNHLYKMLTICKIYSIVTFKHQLFLLVLFKQSFIVPNDGLNDMQCRLGPLTLVPWVSVFLPLESLSLFSSLNHMSRCGYFNQNWHFTTKISQLCPSASVTAIPQSLLPSFQEQGTCFNALWIIWLI